MILDLAFSIPDYYLAFVLLLSLLILNPIVFHFIVISPFTKHQPKYPYDKKIIDVRNFNVGFGFRVHYIFELLAVIILISIIFNVDAPMPIFTSYKGIDLQQIITYIITFCALGFFAYMIVSRKGMSNFALNSLNKDEEEKYLARMDNLKSKLKVMIPRYSYILTKGEIPESLIIQQTRNMILPHSLFEEFNLNLPWVAFFKEMRKLNYKDKITNIVRILSIMIIFGLMIVFFVIIIVTFLAMVGATLSDSPKSNYIPYAKGQISQYYFVLIGIETAFTSLLNGSFFLNHFIVRPRVYSEETLEMFDQFFEKNDIQMLGIQNQVLRKIVYVITLFFGNWKAFTHARFIRKIKKIDII